MTDFVEEQYSKTLMFHQSLGLGALSYVQGNHPNYEQTIVSQLVAVLPYLLPNTSQEDIQRVVRKFIGKALALKAAMIKEQAVYRCFIANGEDRFDPESMEIKEDDTGQVYL